MSNPFAGNGESRYTFSCTTIAKKLPNLVFHK